jgi:membrane fusion protein, heavy metal efflux system
MKCPLSPKGGIIAIDCHDLKSGHKWLSICKRLFKKIGMYLLIFSLWGIRSLTYAQHTHADGSTHEDHGVAEPAAEAIKMKKSEAVSERYELVLKYEHLHAGEDGKLILYVADPVTN